MKSLRLFTIIYISLFATSIFASPHNMPPPPSPRHTSHYFSHRPPPSRHHHHNNDVIIGSSIVGGAILGSAILNSVTTPLTTSPATIITPSQPVIITPLPQQKVWINGHYEERIVNGFLTKIWVPGYWTIVQ